MSLDRVYRDIESLKQLYKGLAGGPQLALSSIENGSIDSKDADGNLKMTIGEQDDGGNTINVLAGPTPPTPVEFTVDTDYGKIVLHWSGVFDGDALAPSDWSRAEVHASQDPFFVPSRATARGSIVSAAGGEVTIGVLKGPWTIKMLAWSQAGKMSAPSAPVDVEVPGYGDIVLEEIDAATTLIKNAGEMLLEGQQTLAEKLAGIADLDPEEISEEIAQARQEAIDAALEEIANVEGTLTSAIGGKSSTKWSTSDPPANYDGAVGDTWVKLTSLGSGGREIRRSRWQGDVWVDHPVDGAILSNLDASTINTGFLDVVNRIRAGAILADKMLIGDFTNLHTDPTFANPAAAPGTWTVVNGGLEKNGTGAQNGAYETYLEIPVQPGEKFYIEANRETLAGTVLGIVTIYVQQYNASTSVWGTPIQALNMSSNGKSSSTFTIGTTTSKIRFGYYTQATMPTATRVRITNPIVRRQAGSTLIEPGGIKTPNLAADVLEVGNLKAGTAALAEAVITKLWSEVVVARMVQAEAFIGENAILTGAITAPKITASEELWAKIGQFATVRAEMMDADVFIGRRFEGVDISASRFTAGTAVEITDSYGIRQFGPDGALNVSLPSDGSTAWISADIRAKSLTVTGAMSIEGPGKVASGGQLQLESGVTPPATPPNVSSYAKRTPFPALAANENAVGLAFDGTYFWRAIDNSVTDGPDRMERIDVDGNLVSSFEHYFWVRNGITIIGSEIFALGIEEGANRDKSKRFIYVYDFAGTLKRKWEYAAYGSGTYQPGIGTDGADIFVTQCWAEGNISWRRYNKTTGVGQARYDSDHKLRSDIVSADIGSFDFGSSTMVITKANENGTVEIYNPTNGTHPDWGGWYAGDKEQVRGTVWANGRFHHLSAAGNLITMSTVKYPNGAAGPETEDWWVAATWVNGSNETTIGPVRKFAWRRRAGVQVSAGSVPTGVAKVRVYLGRKASEPTRTELANLITGVAADSALRVADLPSTWATGANPPAVNSFPNSTPGIIRSTAGGFEVKGDGSGKWGPLTFNADGTMSSSAVPAWIPITTFATGYGPQTWGFVPAYRIWPDGKVEWRGVVAMTGTPPSSNNMTTGSADVLTIPAAARPTQPVNVAAASTSGINLRRIEFSPASASTVLRFYNGGQSGAWVSLETIYYYLT